MSKEELEKESEEKFKVSNKDEDREHFYDRMWFKIGYLAGAEPREKRIEELEQQIEKMKCPWNCRKFGHCKLSNCPCDKWELQR